MKTSLKITYFFWVLFLSTIIKAQELPPIQNFSPVDYEGGNQNWMISQHSDKTIFVANNSGLLSYNGSRWSLNGSSNGSAIRSVKVINDLIYTGSYMDFGFWKYNTVGELEYTSLITKLNEPLIEDEQFWNIEEFDNWILFQSLHRIYIYHKEREAFEVIEAKSEKAKIFLRNNTIYFQKEGEGIFRIENGKAILVSKNNMFKEHNLIETFIVDNTIVLLLEDGSFYRLIDDNLIRWNISADAAFEKEKVYSGIQLSDKSLVIGTISNGIYHLDIEGNIIEKINRAKGLQDNTILSMFEDKNRNLWLGLDNGIALLNLDSHFSEYYDYDGELGVVYASKVYKGRLYLGTNQGLFYRPIKGESSFKLVSNTAGQIWSLKQVDETLFCGGHEGTFTINGGKASKISSIQGTWDIKKIPTSSNLLIQGNYEGFSLLERTGKNWKLKSKIQGFNISARYFEFTRDNQIIINHDQKGVFILNFDDEYNKVISSKNLPSFGYGSSLVNFNEQIIYTTNLSRGVYRFNEEFQKFETDSILTEIFYPEGEGLIGTLISDKASNRIWGFSNQNIINVSKGTFNNELVQFKIPVSQAFRRSFGVEGFENIVHIEDQKYLVGTSNGYFILNLNKNNSQKHVIKIDGIVNETIDGTIRKLSIGEQYSFNSNENNFKIKFNVSDYQKYSKTEYQYQLEGLYNNWSSWSDKSELDLKNLPFGEYKLKIRSKIGGELSSNEILFAFAIGKPWYLTTLSILIYLSIVVLFSIFMHRVYKRYYKREQERAIKRTEQKLKIENLKNEKELMRIKNENLNLDIENRNREVGIATMNLIKKNEFLNSLKKELKKVDSANELERIIQIIDKDINSSNDWKLFEQAFTNADREFFDKIKKIHPNLTPNDLKLCAYLRLNLSSKEIAQLLNISTRSVEIKRYRLRKKIELPRENNLSQYILEI